MFSGKNCVNHKNQAIRCFNRVFDHDIWPLHIWPLHICTCKLNTGLLCLYNRFLVKISRKFAETDFMNPFIGIILTKPSDMTMVSHLFFSSVQFFSSQQLVYVRKLVIIQKLFELIKIELFNKRFVSRIWANDAIWPHVTQKKTLLWIGRQFRRRIDKAFYIIRRSVESTNGLSYVKQSKNYRINYYWTYQLTNHSKGLCLVVYQFGQQKF